MLELTRVRKCYGAKVAIDNLNLRVEPGEMVAIIGRSGAGKSTLLRLINRLTEADAGEIRWQDRDIGALNGRALREWRAHSAMIFQRFNLVERLDVITNVLIGSLHRRRSLASLIKYFPVEDRARAILELDRVGMADKALQRAETLSGGEMQRVAIARAMMQQPGLLLADEPVSALDPFNATGVMNALVAANRERGITVLVNTHTLDLAKRFCPRLIGLRGGAVMFDGSPAELDERLEADVFGNHAFRPAA
ncbi:phosphonate ABC transporter ATP-binding protein [Sphingomonas sp. GlSt437]|uniref:phosphonate ABC transporter ATP-binding protein n=1 Tax=Sphingomonas sp. GlSt437 TaxID=3389970 RepID=UPI003A83D540